MSRVGSFRVPKSNDDLKLVTTECKRISLAFSDYKTTLATFTKSKELPLYLNSALPIQYMPNRYVVMANDIPGSEILVDHYFDATRTPQ